MSGENSLETKAEAKEFLLEEERHALDLVKMKRALALTNAEKAELQYNNLILQLTIKYSLKEKDGITEQGEIVRSGAGV